MSVEQENELPTSPPNQIGKRSWTKLMRDSLAQVQNSMTSQDVQVGTQQVETHGNGTGEAHFNTPSDTSFQGSQDQKTPRVARNPSKAIYRWFRANTFHPTWLPKGLRYPISGYLAAVLLQVIAVLATLLLTQLFPTFIYPGALEFLTIILVAVTWGAGPSVIATLAGITLLDYVVLPPHFHWTFATAQDIVEAVLFLAVGLAISIIATRIELARRNAEELATSLAAERARLDAVIETVPDIVSIHDATGRIVRVNRAMQEKVGDQGNESLADILSLEQVSGGTYGLRTITGEHFTAEALPVARALQGEVISNVEMHKRDAAGNERYMLVSAAPMRDLSGKIEGVVAITRDISALRQTEFAVAIRASELEATFETMADAVFVFGSDGQVQRMNAAARELFALDVGINLSQPLQERGYKTVVLDEHDSPLPEEEWPLFRVVRGEVLTSGNALDMRVRTGTGRKVELSVSGAPLLDHEGHILGAVCICRDVTERRILERRTSDALKALLTMAEALVLVPDPATSTTGELSFTGSSRVAQRLMELTCSVLGCKRVAITSVESETNELQAIAAVGLSPEQEHEWRARRPGFILSNMFVNAASTGPLSVNEARIIDMTQPPFSEQPNPYDIRVMLLAPMNVGNQLVGILSVDYGDDEHEYTPEEIALAGAVAKLGALVLERERLLRERAEARANELALRAANTQMEEFLGMISHELKTPLTSIKGNTQLAMRQLKNSIQTFGKLLQLQESAEHQSRRLNRIVDDLLDVSRTRAGHLELRLAPCDLVAIVRESVEEQRRVWPERMITFDVPEEMTVYINADADRIGQVIVNYLTNALKYSDDDQPVQVNLELEGEEAYVAVHDEGPGLSAEDQERVWDRFQRVPGIEVRGTPLSSTAGLGLGLYISKMIIEGHAGQVGVESVPREGSTFWFTLPLAKQDNH